MQPVVKFKNLSKRFGQTVALNDVTLEIPPGVVCAVLGANGAGKSTAIRILLGLDKPDAGFAEALGMDSKTHALEIRGRVGYVADQPPLYEWMTVAEIGWFAAGFYPTGYKAEYDKLTTKFDLDGKQKIANLSKGMRAKVALSLAMAHRPELLILDEPTSGLDPLVRREFLESMIDVSAEGRSVLLSSHQVSEVERVADIVAILLNGKLVCVERLDDLKRDTTEVAISMPDETTPPPAMPGINLAHVSFGHDHVWMVRDLNEAQLRESCRSASLPEPQIRKPNLEDILLAILREYRRDPLQKTAQVKTDTAVENHG
ncbi:ABC transporter ATP-binding protein [Fuerstiella marisgermanici]|uniref:Putative ABC transporter ATP-binding protein YbhF n=1 Tax=Fuerstiella marisgermanici TaxID=1891926 RepID=A0A1P8WIT0_9PLAN|nr:ABC transporter ATP-binding protein [Fuerstiella marisgermanici]APZ93972.1 putative ABC transporter ATP-binding protein YbhF [Fuerstiella marisgermanici]